MNIKLTIEEKEYMEDLLKFQSQVIRLDISAGYNPTKNSEKLEIVNALLEKLNQ